MVVCGQLLNGILEAFKVMTQNDMLSIEHIKGEWMHVDNELAHKTLGESLSDMFKIKP